MTHYDVRPNQPPGGCLLICSVEGRIVSSGSEAISLIGWKSQSLVGHQIDEFVDGFEEYVEGITQKYWKDVKHKDGESSGTYLVAVKHGKLGIKLPMSLTISTIQFFLSSYVVFLLTPVSKKCMVVVADETSHILSVNKTVLTTFCCSEQDLLGKSVKVLMPGRYQQHHQSFVKHSPNLVANTNIGKNRLGLAKTVDDERVIPVHMLYRRNVSLTGKSLYVGIITRVSKTESRISFDKSGRISNHVDSLCELAFQLDGKTCIGESITEILPTFHCGNDGMMSCIPEINSEKMHTFVSKSGEQFRLCARIEKMGSGNYSLVVQWGEEESNAILRTEVLQRLPNLQMLDHHALMHVGKTRTTVKVTDKSTQQQQVLQIISAEDVPDDGWICEENERVLHEVSFLQNLSNHDRFLDLLDVIDFGDRITVTTEYCLGGTLYERVHKMGIIDEARARCIIRQILDAMICLQECSYAHSHLTCDHVVFKAASTNDNGWDIVVTGLGSIVPLNIQSRHHPNPLGHSIQSRDLPSIISACSPEMLAGHVVDWSMVDVWQLGAVLYFMVCGSEPFSSLSEVCAVTCTIPRFVSDTCAAFILSTLAPDPQKRPSLQMLKCHMFVTGFTSLMSPSVLTLESEISSENSTPTSASSRETPRKWKKPVPLIRAKTWQDLHASVTEEEKTRNVEYDALKRSHEICMRHLMFFLSCIKFRNNKVRSPEYDQFIKELSQCVLDMNVLTLTDLSRGAAADIVRRLQLLALPSDPIVGVSFCHWATVLSAVSGCSRLAELMAAVHEWKVHRTQTRMQPAQWIGLITDNLNRLVPERKSGASSRSRSSSGADSVETRWCDSTPHASQSSQSEVGSIPDLAFAPLLQEPKFRMLRNGHTDLNALQETLVHYLTRLGHMTQHYKDSEMFAAIQALKSIAEEALNLTPFDDTSASRCAAVMDELINVEKEIRLKLELEWLDVWILVGDLKYVIDDKQYHLLQFSSTAPAASKPIDACRAFESSNIDIETLSWSAAPASLTLSKSPPTITSPLRRKSEDGMVNGQPHLEIAHHDESTQGTALQISSMGEPYTRKRNEKIDIADIAARGFTVIKAITKGAYGTVYLAKHDVTGTVYALKAQSKSDMLRKNMVGAVVSERDIMAIANNPFTVSLIQAFQSREHLFFVMEYCPGGDLFSLLQQLGTLSEHQTRLYVSEMILALQYLHSLHIIHRDIKPDNMLIDIEGHIKLTDFGLAKLGMLELRESLVDSVMADPSTPRDTAVVDTSSKRRLSSGIRRAQDYTYGGSVVGTPDYIAPEALLGTTPQHNEACVDWWGLGCVMWECLTGLPPFAADTVKEVFQTIICGRISRPTMEKDGVELSDEAWDLLQRLLERDPDKRMQYMQNIKNHPWFQGVEWETLRSRPSEFKPVISDSTDTSYFAPRDMMFNIEDLNVSPPASPNETTPHRHSNPESTPRPLELPEMFRRFSFDRWSEYNNVPMSAPSVMKHDPWDVDDVE